MVVAPLELILRLWDAFDLCADVAGFLRHGGGYWQRMRRIGR